MEKVEIQKFYKFTSSAIIDTFGIKTVRTCIERVNSITHS